MQESKRWITEDEYIHLQSNLGCEYTISSVGICNAPMHTFGTFLCVEHDNLDRSTNITVEEYNLQLDKGCSYIIENNTGKTICNRNTYGDPLLCSEHEELLLYTPKQ